MRETGSKAVLRHPNAMLSCAYPHRAVRGRAATSSTASSPPHGWAEARPQLLLAPTAVPWCQARAGPRCWRRRPWHALSPQLGGLRAHRVLRAAVHPGEGRVPALGCLERQQRLPHRAPHVLPPRLLRCECPPGCHRALLSLIPFECPRQQHQAEGAGSGRAEPCQGLLGLGPALPLPMPSRICSFCPVI